jgi:hypothetical protein
MRVFDVFNGDADGICALIQLRLAEPCNATQITGVKRDINLARQVPVDAPAQVNILDVSLDKNREAVDVLLASGCSASFITPLGYQTNLMVYGPGRYRFSDYVRIGTPLSIIVGAVSIALIPLVWQF